MPAGNNDNKITVTELSTAYSKILSSAADTAQPRVEGIVRWAVSWLVAVAALVCAVIASLGGNVSHWWKIGVPTGIGLVALVVAAHSQSRANRARQEALREHRLIFQDLMRFASARISSDLPLEGSPGDKQPAPGPNGAGQNPTAPPEAGATGTASAGTP